MPETAAVVATAILVALSLFQLALALGAPWGAAAYGGSHRGVLPARLRIASAAVVAGYLLGIVLVLGRIGIGPGAGWNATVATVALWLVTVILVLNVVTNLMSRSRVERLIMTPIAAVLAACFAVLAMG